jgi:hypothetical protein
MQFGLLAMGVGAGASVAAAYWTSIAVVRTIHTLYGKRSGLFQ